MDSISFSIFCLLISILVVLFAIKLVILRNSSNKRKRYHPIAGTIINQLMNFSRLHDYMTDLATKNTTYRLLSIFRSEVYTSDPKNVEYMLKTNFSNYGRGKYHYDILTDLLGDGIFTVDGDKWKQQRKLSSYQFSTKILRDLSCHVFKVNAVKLVHMIFPLLSSNQSVDIQDLFMKSALDSVFSILLGVELDTMCGTYEKGQKFSQAFDDASAITLYRYVDIFWKIKKFFNIGSEKVLKQSTEIVDKFVYEIIKRKTELHQLQKMSEHVHEDKNIKGDILSRFLDLNQTDPKYLKDIILSFIIAGKDTTATTLSWFLYMICKNPKIQEKIVEEVKEVTQMKENATVEEVATSITEEVYQKMWYLHATLNETLRLYPAIPVDGKLCFSDDTLPDGFAIKGGDVMAYQPYAMGRSKSIWGDDAEEFKPERWFDENGCFKPVDPFKFTAFQAGPRICIGKEFAYRQMKIFSAILLGSYMFKLSDEKRRIGYRIMLTLQIEGGLHLTATPRLRGIASPHSNKSDK